MVEPANPYQALDRAEISAALFHPRREPPTWQPPRGTTELLIPVDEDIQIGGRFHLAGPGAPNLLFFHGNGEIVADYDEVGQAYARAGINLLAVDYRGYGRSSGNPSATAMLADGRAIFTWTRQWLETEGHTGPLAVMGRSLGSAPALELAAAWPAAIAALIIESGFADTGRLLQVLGLGAPYRDVAAGTGFMQLAKIRRYHGPTLIIHAEQDHLIPLDEGKALYTAAPAAGKHLLTIPDANHNDILLHAWPAYLSAVRKVLFPGGSV